MKGLTMWAVASAALAATSAGCGVTEVTTDELTAVVQRDGVAFVGESIPAGVVDRLASHRLVIIGETHLLWEHRAFLARLVEELHARGFRQLLLEYPQMADWLLNDYARNGPLYPDWAPSIALLGGLIEPIRAFNSTIPADEQIEVRGIDVNLRDYGGAGAFMDLMAAVSEHLGDPGPVPGFLARAYDSPQAQIVSLETLQTELATRENELTASWGTQWFATVVEMVEVELVSIGVRAVRDDDYDRSVRVREDEMKRIADLRLANYAFRSVINVGGNHAQKEYLKGTKQEWLGDYLVNQSTVVGGSVFVVGVSAARIMASSGGSNPVYDIMNESPANELWRTMTEVWPGETVFLPLDDPMFLDGGIPVNFEDKIFVCALKKQYDAVVQYPVANRVPLN